MTSNGRPLAGQVAVVTGAATGIGAAIAEHLAATGAAVAVNHPGDQEYEAGHVLDRVRAAGGDGIILKADLSDTDDVHAMADIVRAELGPVSILVNNAGAYPRVPWAQLDEPAWDRALELNLTIHYRAARAFTPHMTAQRYGRIINIGSITARSGRTGLVGYAAAKAGLHGLTRSLARELGPYLVCVNTVLPGPIQVDRENDLPTHHRTPPAVQVARQCVPRRGQPADIAAAVVFLAGPGASFITGQTLHVDGGWLLH